MITTLSLDQFTRPLWGEYDAWVMAQLEPLAYDPCYKPKWYVAPDSAGNNLFSDTPGVPPVGENGSDVQYGLQITPGGIIVGNLLYSTEPVNFLFKMRDMSLGYDLWDDPIPAYFISNAKGDLPNLWVTRHPVVGTGLFNCEFWNQSAEAQIIQVVFCVLEVCDPQ